MKQTSIILMVVTILTKIFGLAREKALAHFFGTGNMAEIFLVAFSIPMVLTNLFTGAIGTGFIPIYDEIKNNKTTEEADIFTSNLSNILALFSFILSIIAIIFARPLVKAMSLGFDAESLEKAVYISRIALLSISFTAVASIFRAYLQINKKFIVSVSHSIIMNIIIIGAMALSVQKGINYLAFGILAAFVLQYIVFIPASKRSGFKYKKIFDLKDSHLKQMLYIIIPILVSTSVVEVNFIINKSIATLFAEGSMAELNYAARLQSFVTGIVISSIVTVTYPQMSKVVSSNNIDELKKVVGESLSIMSVLVLPATLGLMTFSKEIVRLLFLGGAFSQEDVIVTANVLMFYSLGILGIGIREILSRVFYSMKKTKIPVYNGILMLVINIVLSLTLSSFLQVRGLALATSISMIIGGILMYYSLNKEIGSLGIGSELKNIFKILIASIIMAVLGKLAYTYLSGTIKPNYALLISIGISGIIYGLLLIVLKVNEIKEIVTKIRNR